MKISIGLFLLLVANLSESLPRRPSREKRAILFDYEFFDKLNPFKPKPVQHLILLPYSHLPAQGPETSHFRVHKGEEIRNVAKDPSVIISTPTTGSTVYNGNTVPAQYFKVANINNLPLESSAYNVPSVNYVQIPEEELRNSYTHYISEDNGGISPFVLSDDETPSDEFTTEFPTDQFDIATEDQTSVDEVTDVSDIYGDPLHSLRATDDFQAITPIDAIGVTKQDEPLEESISEVKSAIKLSSSVQVPSQVTTQNADIIESDTKKELEDTEIVNSSAIAKQNEQTNIPIKVIDTVSIDDVDGDKISTREEIKDIKHPIIDVHTQIENIPIRKIVLTEVKENLSLESPDSLVLKQNEQANIPIKVTESESIDDVYSNPISTKEEIKDTKHTDEHTQVENIPIRKIVLAEVKKNLSLESQDSSVLKQNEQTNIPIKVKESESIDDVDTNLISTREEIKTTKHTDEHTQVESIPIRKFSLQKPEIERVVHQKSSIKDLKPAEPDTIAQSEDKVHLTRDFKIKEVSQVKDEKSQIEIVTSVKPIVSKQSEDINNPKVIIVSQQRKDRIVKTSQNKNIVSKIDVRDIKIHENTHETEEEISIGIENDGSEDSGQHKSPAVVKVPQIVEDYSPTTVKDSKLGEEEKSYKLPSNEDADSTKLRGSSGLDSKYNKHKVEVIASSVILDKSTIVKQENKYDHRVILKRPVQREIIESLPMRIQKEKKNSSVIRKTESNTDEETPLLSQEGIPIKKVASNHQKEEVTKEEYLDKVKLERPEPQQDLTEEIPIVSVKKSDEGSSAIESDDVLSTIDNKSEQSLVLSSEKHDSDLSSTDKARPSPEEVTDGDFQKKVRDGISPPSEEGDEPVKIYSLAEDFVIPIDELQSKLKDHSLFITDKLMKTQNRPDNKKILIPTIGPEVALAPSFESKLNHNDVPSAAHQTPEAPIYNFGHSLPGFYLPPHPKTKADLTGGKTHLTVGSGEASENIGVAVFPGILPRTYGLKSYRFNYNVADEPSGTTFSRYENSDGEKTHGQYSVLLPDGRTQIVKFFDEGLGFNADVKYY